MAECMEYSPITLLPNELLSMILMNNNCHEILNFGATCKRFHTLVTSNQYLWKEKFKVTLPQHIYDIAEKYGQGQWLRELKRYFTVKQKVYEELLSMSSRYYWRTNEISMKDVQNFFSIALAHNMNHYYVISVLQDVVRIANEFLDMNYSERPYTLTEMYYAKIALRYLTHTFLAIKWFQNHMGGSLRPEIVLNFFVQWTNTACVHTDEDVEASLGILVEDVEKMFPNGESQPNYSVQEKIDKGLLKQKDVLQAVSEVIYHQHHLALMPSANLENLDIVQVIKTKCGHPVALAAIYQAVANRCGVKCDLIAFPNHLFLEWRAVDQTMPLSCKIDLGTGTIITKGRCPYSRGPVRDDIRYCPDTFLQYIVATFLMTMGALKNWCTQNATYLQDFLSCNPSSDNPYRNYQEYLLDYDRLPAMSIPLNPKFMDYNHLKMLEHLFMITQNLDMISRGPREGTGSRHDSGVLFAVGMICYHQKYDYLCVVRGWDRTCCIDMRRRIEFKSLRYGSEQPFYNVVAVDQSERYVAQENLVDVSRPNRLYHLEDIIAKEFTHFDGYCYIPNTEKEQEYPEDGPIRNVFRSRFDLRAEQRREEVLRAQE